MQSEWEKPREYSFTNAAGEVFHEIAYSREDVIIFAQTNGISTSIRKAVIMGCKIVGLDAASQRGDDEV